MDAFTVITGGAAAASAVALGQVHSAVSTVTTQDVERELSSRGYQIEAVVPVHHVPVAAPILTKSMAISVAIDEALRVMGLPRTASHPYRCPYGGQCAITQRKWTPLVQWCVIVSNGYLTGRYTLPGWAQTALDSGTLHGAALAGIGMSGWLEDVAAWAQRNDWLVKSVGDTITNIGEHLTAKNVQDAIKANTDKAFSKDDALALIAALQQGGYVTAGKAATVAEGANMAASPSWMMPLMIGGAVLLVVMLMKK